MIDDFEGMNNPLAITKAVKNNVTPILITGGAIAALYLVYKIVDKISDPSLGYDRSKQPTTLNDSQASVLAERLHVAMYLAGTDEDTVKDILTGLKHNDFIKVSKSYGKRPYLYLTGEAPVFDWMGADLTLIEWLIQELNQSEINELKQILPDIFI
jgi:hypothetical protein